MDSAIKRLEKQVGEAIREIAVLNERVGGLEQILGTVKDFMEEIKEALALRDEKGKSPLVQSLNKTSPVQMANALGSGGGAHYRGDTDTGLSAMQVSRGTCMPKTVSKPKEMGGTSRNKVGFKKMTKADFLLRMQMSLCFLCDEEDYGENHDCKNKHLQLLLTDDDEDEKDEEEEQGTVMMGGNQNASMSVKNSTVANAVAGAATFKFLGKIGSKEVIVKMGSGASHNFISKEVVAELQLPVERTRSFQVNFGFGHKAKGAAVCNDVVIEAQGIEIVASFFPTNLGIADVMLGFEWLRSIGAILCLGSPQTMTFDWHGRTVTLESDPSLTKGPELGLMTLEWDEED